MVTKGVRGLGKHLPVISSIGRATEKTETYRKIILIVLPCFQKTGMLVLSPRTENDLPVVKDHGKTDFVDPCRVRSRRTHRSNGTEPISTTFLCKNKNENVMVTSDIGLLNAKY